MSLENEDYSSQPKAMETSSTIDKGSRISYTREFLLSLSELEICKKLPSGFDQSILSEFEDASHSSQDRLRNHSSLPVQGFRRTEYGSSPPTRGDSGNYSRGPYGRWDSRPSGRSDQDSDSQSDRESDSGRRFVNQSRKSWQGSEHDGLLGSGSFSRPSGYAAGISTPKIRANDQYQLNRSNEPYHPPRPYKATPLMRRDTDSYNDETFGSSECTSEDRVEEERRRRASFELMRKEQQKTLQEKQKSNLEKHKADSVSDVSVPLDDTKEEKGVIDRHDESSATNSSIPSIDSGKSTLTSQAPCRPLVPPGFKNTVAEKTSDLKSLVQSHSVENGAFSSIERISSGAIDWSNEPPEDKGISIPFLNKGEQLSDPSLDSDVSSNKISVGSFLHQTTVLPEVHEAPNDPEIIKLNAKVSGLKLSGELNENDPKSILDRIFGNTSTMQGSKSMDSVEHHDSKADDSWSQKSVHSSKFAHWFAEEERKTEDDHSSRPTDLLSLIVGSDKGRNQVDMKILQHFPADFPDQRTEIATTPMPTVSTATNGVSESLSNCNKQEVVPTILTCEDLEQTILSEYGEKSPHSEPPLEGWSLSGAKSKLPKAVDNHASQHLLSLLQKGAILRNTTPKTPADNYHSEMLPASNVYDVGAVPQKFDEEIGTDNHASGESLTLETLFGTAFMKELKSVEAPVSVQMGSARSAQAETSEPQGRSFPVADNVLFSSTVNQIELDKMTNEMSFLVSNSRQQEKMDKTEKWLGYDDPQIELNLSKHQSVVPKHGGFDGSSEYHLPEEESLMAAKDDLNTQISRSIPGRNSNKKEFSTSNAVGDIAEKLAAIGAVNKGDRSTTGSDGPPFLLCPYDQMEREIAYRDLHTQTSSSHFHSMQMSHGRPLLHPMDSHPAHVNSQMKFLGRENMSQPDAPNNQQFPMNMLQPPFHQSNVGVAHFDHPAHHPMLQKMQMPGSLPPHLVNDFPRGTPVPNLSNQAPSFMQELNPMPGYPFGHQLNIGGLRMPLPAPDINGGSNHPEAFQRLVEMELRAKSKQIPPFAVGHNQTMYGHEVDMGFRYR